MKFKHIISSLIISLLAFFSVQAQEISVYFVSMPNELILPLDINRRKDLMDLYDKNKEAKVQNSFKKDVILQKMTDNYMLLQSGNSTTEIIMLSMVNHSQIICMIKTACAPVCDSRISFYTTDWKELDTADFFTPVDASRFYKETSDPSGNSLIQSVATDISLMQYQLDPENQTLTQTYNTPLYWSPENKKQIEPFLTNEPQVFRWEKNQFRQKSIQENPENK